jgi:hypothetical protein
MYKSKECTEGLKLLAGGDVLVFPRSTEAARPIYVKVFDVRKPVRGSELL